MAKTRSRMRMRLTKTKRANTKNKTKKYGSGFADYFKTKPATTPENSGVTNTSQSPVLPPTDKNESKSSSADYLAYVKNTGKGSRAALNMPALLDAVSSKLNALLIHNKVNYKFSNGYTAKDYDINEIPGEQGNDGRGILKPNATRGKITGFQSGVYTTGINTYNASKKSKEPSTLPSP